MMRDDDTDRRKGLFRQLPGNVCSHLHFLSLFFFHFCNLGNISRLKEGRKNKGKKIYFKNNKFDIMIRRILQTGSKPFCLAGIFMLMMWALSMTRVESSTPGTGALTVVENSDETTQDSGFLCIFLYFFICLFYSSFYFSYFLFLHFYRLTFFPFLSSSFLFVFHFFRFPFFFLFFFFLHFYCFSFLIFPFPSFCLFFVLFFSKHYNFSS
ncbi:unnamed protein product [Acanthosepion pharaonis]|uniref:Uncharacterized protein n=1 Tax=Acanthosepion pharaonis TaxID=158019 RepID=A0A812DCZ6_ACAPH|nr:unnamed protein product [Sepia pharaonis]